MATAQVSDAATDKGLPLGMDASMVDEYAAQSKLLQEFVKIPSVGKAWIFNVKNENASRAMVSFSQSDLLANKKRKFLLNAHISKAASKSLDFQWSPFPTEITGVSAVIPSPSGEKLLLVRNAEDDSPTKLEIWGSCQLDNEIHIAKSVHGSLYTDECPDGKYLVFISAKSAVDSGSHNATNSMHRIKWPTDGKLNGSLDVDDVVPVVMCPQDGCFPGLYSSGLLMDPWLSDGRTMILSSVWGSKEVIVSVNVASCEVSRVSPEDSDCSWNVLALDKDNILAVSSSLITVPQMYYGFEVSQTENQWEWQEISSPFPKPSDKISSILAEHELSILKIPISNTSDKLANGAKLPFEAMLVSQKNSASSPTIVVLHGGPHSVYPSSYSKSLAFLFSQGYNLLVVNYRGSLGFGEEALQSLPGNVGSQDVNDVLTALDFVVKRGLVDPSKVAVVGGSHGGFLTTHLIGQWELRAPGCPL